MLKYSFVVKKNLEGRIINHTEDGEYNDDGQEEEEGGGASQGPPM